MNRGWVCDHAPGVVLVIDGRRYCLGCQTEELWWRPESPRCGCGRAKVRVRRVGPNNADGTVPAEALCERCAHGQWGRASKYLPGQLTFAEAPA